MLAVIPTFVREREDLDVSLRTIASVRASAPAVEVLVVDDCSPAQHLLVELEDQASQLEFELLRNPENEGFSRTVNRGLRVARAGGQDAVLINADIECLTDGWDRIISEQDASVVGAKLLYPGGELIQHAGVFFCQPGDEPILTAQDGYVPIEQLDSTRHGLVSYARKEHRIFRCATEAGRRRRGSGRRAGHGYEFIRESRPYVGELVAIQTGRSSTRVTPNHRLTVRWNVRALASWAVYLMRRGEDWRVGHVKLAYGGTAGARGWAFGPRLRMDQQGADGVWILSVHESKQDALKQESLIAWTYGVPTWQFRTSGEGGLAQGKVDELWAEYPSRKRGLALLSAFGRHPGLPLVEPLGAHRLRRAPVGPSRRYEITAANLMPEYMTIPTDPGRGQTPQMRSFGLDHEPYLGDVFSLDVIPHRHYVSGGMILHNSLLTRSFDHRFRFAPGTLPEANIPCVCPVTGAFQFIRHATLIDCGLYDEEYRMAWEDVEYCLRVFESGRECVYCPEVSAIHHESLFRGRADRKLSEWQEQSLRRLLKQHQRTNMARFVPELI